LVLLPTKIAVKAFVIRAGRFAFQNYWVQGGKLPHRVFSRTYGRVERRNGDIWIANGTNRYCALHNRPRVRIV